MLGSMALITINGWMILRQLGNRTDPGFAVGLLVGVIGTALMIFAMFDLADIFLTGFIFN